MTATTPSLSPELARQLEQLKDIHLPPDIGWWPLAPGWWVLAGIAAAAAVGAAIVLRVRRRSVRYRALAELETLRGNKDLACAAVAERVAVLLKRTALQTGTKRALGVAHGESWVESVSRGPGGISVEIARFLAAAPYAGPALAEAAPDRAAILAQAERWIRRNA